jgi:hypothetical protein
MCTICVTALIGCGTPPGVPQPELPVFSSYPVTAEGLNYLQNTQQIITELTEGVSQGRLPSNSLASLSATTGGRTDDVYIYFYEEGQTGDGFQLGLTSQSQQAGNLTMREIKGNICITYKQPPPPELAYLSPAEPESAVLSSVRREIESGVQCYNGIAVAGNTGTFFGIVDPPGGWIIVQGEQVELQDKAGNTLTRFRFSGRDIEQEIENVINTYIAPPNEKIIGVSCGWGYQSVSNAKIFSAFQSLMENGKQEVADFIVSNTASYDCKKGEYDSHIFVSFQSHQNGVEYDVVAFQKKTPPVQPPVALPVINEFKADWDSILAGESVELSWDVSHADTITINPGVGSISTATGTIEVKPVQTTTYTLTASNSAGSVSSTIKITVYRDPTPTPPLTACPPGYVCMTEAEVQASPLWWSKYSSYQCSPGKYCWRQIAPPTPTPPLTGCPSGCVCMTEAEAQASPLYWALYSNDQCSPGRYCWRQITPPTPTPPTPTPPYPPAGEVLVTVTSYQCQYCSRVAGTTICDRVLVKGTATGPVGSTICSSTDTMCNNWTRDESGCWTRGPNDPETTDWEDPTPGGCMEGVACSTAVEAGAPSGWSKRYIFSLKCP